ncbi:MAG: nuclear transport factor 2 family protein [Mycobacteriales bacterium]
MTAESNAALIRTMVDEFRRGELDRVATHFAPDAVWDLPGRGVLAGTYKGPDEIVGFLARAFELSGGTLSVEVMDVLASEAGGCHVQHVTAHRDGRQLDCVEVLAHEIADGQIIRTYHRPDQYAIDAFFE